MKEKGEESKGAGPRVTGYSKGAGPRVTGYSNGQQEYSDSRQVGRRKSQIIRQCA